jgi:hypothetical protein
LQAWEAEPASIGIWDWDIAMPTDPYVEGTENTEEPVERKGFAREWGQFLVAFLIQVDELLTAEGVVTDNASKEKLADLLAKRLQDAMAAHGRICGDYSPDPLPNTFPVWEGRRVPLQAVTKTSADRPVVSLDGICDGWKSVSVVKPRTVDETVYAVRDLKEFLGHSGAARITRDDLTRWRKAMKDAGRSVSGAAATYCDIGLRCDRRRSWRRHCRLRLPKRKLRTSVR